MSGLIRDAGAVEVAGSNGLRFRELADLLRGTVNKDDADIQRSQDSDVQQQVGKVDM